VLSDPVTFMITAGLSVAYSVATIAMDKAAASNGAVEYASWMVSQDILESRGVSDLPHEVRMMVALHCYSTALSGIAERDLQALINELKERSRPIEKAVIGLALAQRGYHEIRDQLVKLRHDSDWPVRVLAYEGLVALSQATGSQPINETYEGLQDSEPRVSVAVASAMASTGNSVYVPQLLKVVEVKNNKQRLGGIPILINLAMRGISEASEKLNMLAATDSDKDIRQAASDAIEKYLESQ